MPARMCGGYRRGGNSCRVAPFSTFTKRFPVPKMDGPPKMSRFGFEIDLNCLRSFARPLCDAVTEVWGFMSLSCVRLCLCVCVVADCPHKVIRMVRWRCECGVVWDFIGISKRFLWLSPRWPRVVWETAQLANVRRRVRL